MTQKELYHLQEAIRAEGLGGWLFYNFHHRDIIADTILHINPESTNSRLWIYAVPSEGEPLKIVHVIEKEILDSLPGMSAVYLSRDDFIAALQTLSYRSWGVHISDTLPAVSYLDAGTASLLEKAGLILVSAEGLIQRFKGVLDPIDIETHENAAKSLYDIIHCAWEEVRKAYAAQKVIYEGDLRKFLLDELKRRNLITDHPPIVAAGVNSGNPHYDFSGTGKALQPGEVLQFDIWARENREKAIYADISWAGVYGNQPLPKIEQAFTDLVQVREAVYDFIGANLNEGCRLSGLMVDAKARELLTAKGYASALKHRTGHGIDTECHGSGVNMDSIEFPDSRPLLEGSCFSLEPGIYFSDFGLRTEINVYILKGKPIISGKDRQFTLLTC
jgi:Xaa-Pro aminopeptidase